MNKTTLVDTSAFYAAIDRGDNYHKIARDIFRKAVSQKWKIITTNFIIAETHVLLLTKFGIDTGIKWLKSIPCEVERISEEDEWKAREIIFRYADKSFSYCDACSFAIMERLEIKEAFSFDRHFIQYGSIKVIR